MTETTESRQPQSAQAAHETGSQENPPPSETSAGTAAPQAAVERVTDVAAARQQERPPKDPKKVAAGRAGAAARKAKNERLLEELRAAKESFRPGEAARPASTGPPRPPKDQAPARADGPQECSQGERWTPWIIGVALGAAGGALMFFLRPGLMRGMQPPARPKLVATPRQPTVKIHLDGGDPFHME